MIDITNTFITLILISIIYKYYQNSNHNITIVKSTVNNKEYMVRNLEDKQEASNLLAKISIKMSKLVNYLKTSNNKDTYKKYIEKEDNTNLEKFNEDIKRLIRNFNPDEISESSPDAKYTSYSVNKGERIVFCLRAKKKNSKLVDENTMMFVAIHELGHLMTKSIGHTPEFWNNFKILLKIAIDIEVYDYIDFNKNPEPYCGTEITDTPYKK